MKSGRLYIVGAGGHGRVSADCARAAGCWSEILFCDDRYPTLLASGAWPVVAPSGHLGETNDSFFVAIGHAIPRLQILHRLLEAGRDVATLVHPRATVSPDVDIGVGTLIAPGAVVSIGVRTGIGCIVNTGATVDHDCNLADGVHIAPGAHVSGTVSIGSRSWIGVGASIRQGLSIDSDVTVGAGAAVVADLAECNTYAGVPARLLRRTQ